MGLHKPFDKIWWCDYDSVPLALVDTGSLIGVNRRLIPREYFDWDGAPTPRPVIWLPHDENKPVSQDYLLTLICVADAMFTEYTPITFWCRAGQHRSPAAAIVAQAAIHKQPLEECVAAVTKIWTDFGTKHRHGVFAASLFAEFEKLRAK